MPIFDTSRSFPTPVDDTLPNNCRSHKGIDKSLSEIDKHHRSHIDTEVCSSLTTRSFPPCYTSTENSAIRQTLTSAYEDTDPFHTGGNPIDTHRRRNHSDTSKSSHEYYSKRGSMIRCSDRVSTPSRVCLSHYRRNLSAEDSDRQSVEKELESVVMTVV